MKEGWLIDRDNHWIWRFWLDDGGLVKDPWVFLDRGRKMPEGPPLLKERRHLRKEMADQLWQSLLSQGWKATEPAWSAAADI